MIEYELCYKKVKHVTLRIQADGTLKVTAPRKTSNEYIENLIMQKMQWITQHVQQMEQLQQQRKESGLVNRYMPEGQVAYLGKAYPLRADFEGRRDWLWTGTELLLTGCQTEAHIRQMVEAFYRQQMLEEVLPALNEEVRQQLAALQLPMPAFVIRKMRASWGLCYSKEQKIVLNLWLAMVSLDCIRQVLVHEYLHFCQNNHSSKFYALLEQFEPQYRQLKHKLSIMVDLTEQVSSPKKTDHLQGVIHKKMNLGGYA